MSDLKDLAITLEEMGLVEPLIEDETLHIYRPKKPNAVPMKFVITQNGIVFLGKKQYGDWVARETIFLEDWPILEAIRQWQSPAPSGPSAADAVTISRADAEAVRLLVSSADGYAQERGGDNYGLGQLAARLEAALADGRS